MEVPVPKYTDLPELVPGYRCSWSYFNSLPGNKGNDAKDQIGTLNFLTAERKALATQEVRKGISISLELPVTYFAAVSKAFGGRAPPEHKVLKVAPFVHEDSLSTNTQVSSQWDGLRHFGFRSTAQFYNGYTEKDFEGGSLSLGTDAWHRAGGIVGRGVLIDFHTWAKSQGKSIDVNGGYSITLADIKSILSSQNTTINPGDILIFRTGWLAWYNSVSPSDRYTELCVNNTPGGHSFIGLAQEEALVAWLWENQVSAVAADCVAFESTPPPSEGFGWLHEHLLGALGCPMGELFDAEMLADECGKQGRYSFLLTSAPMHIPGGVASTCNALAML